MLNVIQRNPAQEPHEPELVGLQTYLSETY